MEIDQTQKQNGFRLILSTLFIIGLCFVLAQFVTILIFSSAGLTDLKAFLSDDQNITGLSVFRLAHLISSLLSFVLPSFLIAWLLYRTPMQRLMLNVKPHFAWFMLPAAILFIGMPWMNFVVKWNEMIKFPESMSAIYNSLRSSEDMALLMTEKILAGSNFSTLLINLFLVALVPAIGEELLFRGVIQSCLKDISRNVHVAVLVSAVIFSAIHFQFFGFFARFLLGAFFGYLVAYSGSLWPAIWAHFFNNAMAVLAHFYISKGVINKSTEDFGSNSSDINFTIISLIITIVLLLFLFRKFKTKL